VLLGASLFDPKWIVGFSDDRHVCTIATNRAGKGRSVIIPNLITWRGSVLVIDPKGQNALVTAMARGKGGAGLTHPLGQTVRVLDPLGEIREPLLQNCKARFNPIAGLDPRDPATSSGGNRVQIDYTTFLDPNGLRRARIGVARTKFFGYSDVTDKIINDAIDSMKAQGAVIVDLGSAGHGYSRRDYR